MVEEVSTVHSVDEVLKQTMAENALMKKQIQEGLYVCVRLKVEE
jgi:hypothetical protein